MLCQKCGSQNPDNASACGVCGTTLTGSGEFGGGIQPQINNYLIPAILSTICCCPPLGLVSIIYAAQVNGMLASRNIDGARKAADSAKMWFWISLGVGAAVSIISTVFALISIITAVNAVH